MKPAMEQLISDYKNTDGILVASIVCDKEGSSLCSSHGVNAYPTMYIYDSNDKKQHSYNGDRSHSDLKKFVTKYLGAPAADSVSV